MKLRRNIGPPHPEPLNTFSCGTLLPSRHSELERRNPLLSANAVGTTKARQEQTAQNSFFTILIFRLRQHSVATDPAVTQKTHTPANMLQFPSAAALTRARGDSEGFIVKNATRLAPEKLIHCEANPVRMIYLQSESFIEWIPDRLSGPFNHGMERPFVARSVWIFPQQHLHKLECLFGRILSNQPSVNTAMTAVMSWQNSA